MLPVTSQEERLEAVRPVLTVKLRRPAMRPDAVTRPRLHVWPDRSPRPALTLVSAPAGFGKTTLVNQWLSATDARSAPALAWVSLEAGDADPVTFWRYVHAAIARATGVAGADVESFRTWSGAQRPHCSATSSTPSRICRGISSSSSTTITSPSPPRSTSR